MSYHAEYDERNRLAKEFVSEHPWETLTAENLDFLWGELSKVDSSIASLYGVTKNAVTAKRKKLQVGRYASAIRKYKEMSENTRPFAYMLVELNAESKKILFTDINTYSKALTSYVYRNNAVVENIHAGDGLLSDANMKIINKEVTNKMAEVMILMAEERWFDLLTLLQWDSICTQSWDEAEPNMKKVNEVITAIMKSPFVVTSVYTSMIAEISKC